MLEKLIQIFKIKDLRKKILFVLTLLVIFRAAAHIPIPGVDVESLRRFFEGNQILGLLNMFSGGGMENFSVVAMGVAPYITASIIVQLLIMIVPALEKLAKQEGEVGRQKINQIMRWLTVPLAVLQSYAMISLLQRAGQKILGDLSPFTLATTIITLTGGTIFLMWLGEQITEKGIGNGVSLIIFTGIVVSIPRGLQQALINFDSSKILDFIIFAVIAIVVIAGVVFITEAQRNIPISYARRVRGMKMYGGIATHLPLRVNQAGVIPIIFAMSVMIFPGMVANFFVHAKTSWLANLAQRTVDLFQNQAFYGILYFILVFLFTYFYTAVAFDPKSISENIQKQGGFVPGIRPGRPTAEYLHKTLNRITLVGALFLGAIAVLPYVMEGFFDIPALTIGGTGVLIVVSVVIETMRQIQSQMVMRDYEKFY
jgi:preprotein translocase subunit SecY